MSESNNKKILNVPNLRFAFSGKYEDCFIGNILKIKSGQDQKKVAVQNGKYKIYGTGGVIGFTNTPLYTKESVGIGRKGTIDKPFYFDEPFWTVDTLFYTEIKPNYYPLYVYYLFQTINWKKYNSSTGVPSLTGSTIENIMVSIPKLEEQIKIANFLSCIDKQINTQNKIIEDLQKISKALKEKLIENPTKNISIKNILNEVNEKSTVNNQYPVLSSTVKGLFKQSEYFDRQVASDNNIGYKIVKKGYIVLSPQNLWMGNITYNDKFDIGIVSPSYKTYKVRDGLDASLVFAKLTTKKLFYNYSLVSEQGASVVRRNLNIESFEELPIPFNDACDSKIIKLLMRIKNKEKNENILLEKYNNLKKYLLQNLFI